MISLRLIDKTITSEEIQLLVDWRRSTQHVWHETFTVTHEKTKKWIHDIIENSNRMIFFVIDADEIIGHVGFDDMDIHSFYIGSIIRGRGKSNGAMSIAVQMLIDISRKFRVHTVYLKVYMDNTHAIRFYKKLGFKKEREDSPFYIMHYDNNTHRLA